MQQQLNKKSGACILLNRKQKAEWLRDRSENPAYPVSG
jgi:hypothetical protein